MTRQLYGRKILKHFQVAETDLLGAGGESRVYALDDGQILRLFAPSTKMETIETLKAFYDGLDLGDLDLEIPSILEVGLIDDAHYSIEPRISGTNLIEAFPELSGSARRLALESYIRAAASVHRIAVRADSYGEILENKPVQANTWLEFLETRATLALERSKVYLSQDVPDLEALFDRWCRGLERLGEPAKHLVHGDFFPGNVMVNEAGLVQAIIDFSPLTVIGDWRMDLAGAVIFLDVTSAYQGGDSQIAKRAVDRVLGEDSTYLLELYLVYYSIYFSAFRDDDSELYAWCVKNLNGVSGG